MFTTSNVSPNCFLGLILLVRGHVVQLMLSSALKPKPEGILVINAASPAGLPHRDAAARIASIDLLRGLIMALMALDHTRAFILGPIPIPLIST